jgi:hypothetical protein
MAGARDATARAGSACTPAQPRSSPRLRGPWAGSRRSFVDSGTARATRTTCCSTPSDDARSACARRSESRTADSPCSSATTGVAGSAGPSSTRTPRPLIMCCRSPLGTRAGLLRYGRCPPRAWAAPRSALRCGASPRARSRRVRVCRRPRSSGCPGLGGVVEQVPRCCRVAGPGEVSASVIYCRSRRRRVGSSSGSRASENASTSSPRALDACWIATARCSCTVRAPSACGASPCCATVARSSFHGAAIRAAATATSRDGSGAADSDDTPAAEAA